MEAALLVCDVIGITLVLLWAARRQGTQGLFAWRSDEAAQPPKRRRRSPEPRRQD
jgi:hypothetical protein